MENTKKTAVTLTTSSMVDLKAELFRKQEEFKRQKAAGSGFVKGVKPEKNNKGGIWNQQNAGVLARAQKDEASRTSEEDDVHTKSRKALEEKARLYDKLCNSATIPDEDGSDYYLVDFQKKVIDSIVEDREANRKKEAEEEEAERVALAAAVPKPVDPDEEWIDFKDSLGRDRRCMKKDLDHLMKQDRDLALAASRKARESAADGESHQLPSLMSSDMHREIMRQKWEDEMKELQEKGQQEIHYSNVQFDEIRSHGVGFFQFSKDHEKREEQLEDLKKMREETVDEHSRKERIKEKRKAMMEARLAKVRQRRNLKEPAPEVKPECNEDSGVIGPKLSEASLAATSDDVIKKEEIEKQAEEKRKAHIREWDRGKQTDLPGRKSYVEVLRDEREPEFAPPSLYFEEPKNRHHQASDNQRIRRLHASLKTTHAGLTVPTNSGNDNLLLSGRCDDTEDKTQGNSRAEEASQEHNSSIPERSQIEEQLPETNPSANQHYQTNGSTEIANSWSGAYSGYEHIPYYDGQSDHAGKYGQTEMHLENPSAQHYTGYQNDYMSMQQQQQDHNQWQPAQYTSNTIPHQHYGMYGAGNQLLTDSMNTGWSSGAVATGLSGNQQLTDFMNTGRPSGALATGISGNQQLTDFTNTGRPSGALATGISGNQQLTYFTNTGRSSGAVATGISGNQQLTYFMNTGRSSGAVATGISGNQQLTYFTNTGRSSGPVATGLSDASMSASMQSVVEVEPRKPKIPKMSVVDTRYMKNEEMPPADMPVNAAASVAAVPYVPGSFTAAKQAAAKLYAESVVESGLKHHIMGNPLLYTEDQLAKQELPPPENDGSYTDTGIY